MQPGVICIIVNLISRQVLVAILHFRVPCYIIYIELLTLNCLVEVISQSSTRNVPSEFNLQKEQNRREECCPEYGLPT